MKEIEVEAFLESIDKGVSAPSLILGDDGNNYILKKEGNFNCSFINEVLSYKIAKFLDVPICESAIAHLDKDLVDFDRNIIFVHRFKEGIYFASQEEKNLINNYMENSLQLKEMGKPYLERTWNDFFRKIHNKKDFAKIIAFDLFIANFDRFDHLDNFLVTNENDKNKFIVIDHGHAFFGPNWDTNKIAFLNGYSTQENFLEKIISMYITLTPNASLGTIFKAIEPNIELEPLDNNDFTDVVNKIESINKETILNMLDNIPEEWYVDKESQIKYYTEFLLQHKSNIRIIIQQLANLQYFTNFKGGELEWIETDKKQNIQ
ncbi:hypothetical protein FH114_06985 [Staphylococcus hominis]|uniref:HipA family kinase n=1 Tax=Staphylococcus hominis TaxID=1290 RepID=UPI001F58F3BB|nr:HipA family kinase [Staphylococcus hominis]MCI2886789.1 hypothetical protein [Staphylococcus hominis]